MGGGLESIRTERIYRMQGDGKRILDDMEALRHIDDEAEKLQGRWTALSVLAAIGALIMFFVGIASLDNGTPIPLAIAGALAVALIVCLVIRSKHKNLNFEDRRYETAEALIPLLATDMDPAHFDIRLDLREDDHFKKFVGKREVGHWKCKDYHDPWLELSGRFVDGTSFQLEITDKLQKRSRWKQSRSGKMKRKTKQKKKIAGALQLKVKSSKYPHLQAVCNDARGAVKLPEYAEVKGLQAQPDQLALKVGGPSHLLDGKDLSNLSSLMFMSLYQVLNLSKKITKAEEKTA